MLFQKPSCSEGNFDYDVDLDAQALYEHATMMHASSSSFSTVVVDMITKSAERGCIPAQLKLAVSKKEEREREYACEWWMNA